MPRLNRKLFKQIADLALTRPKAFDMHDWARTQKDCGTVGCIAGWACILGRGETVGQVNGDNPQGLLARAEEALGITHGEAFGLFYTAFWPTDLKELYSKGKKDPKEKAAIIVRRIRRFVRTRQ